MISFSVYTHSNYNELVERNAAMDLNYRSGSDSDRTSTPRERWKKKNGFSSKIQIPEFGGRKGHHHDVADAYRQ